MLHSIQFSLIEYLKTAMPEFNGNVVWMYNGVKLPAKAPYGTVEYLNEGVAGLDKLNEYVASTYYFQVGVFANNASDLTRMQEKAKKLLFKPIDLIDTSVSPAVINGTFNARVTGVTPIKDDDTSNVKGRHRSYIDVTVFSINNLK